MCLVQFVLWSFVLFRVSNDYLDVSSGRLTVLFRCQFESELCRCSPVVTRGDNIHCPAFLVLYHYTVSPENGENKISFHSIFFINSNASLTSKTAFKFLLRYPWLLPAISSVLVYLTVDRPSVTDGCPVIGDRSSR